MSNDFLNLFIERQEKTTPYGSLSGYVEEYVLACCEYRDDAIQLLENNGFKVRTQSDLELLATLNKYWKTTDINYDEFVFGKRRTSFLHFWDVLAGYRVVFFIKENKVKRVSASVDHIALAI